MAKRSIPHLLIVEDNAALSAEMHSTLRREYQVDRVTTLQGAFNYLAETKKPYDLVLIDFHLPDGVGTELIQFIQQDNPSTKICIFTQNADEKSRIESLQLGADTFLTKPLSLRSLSLHVAALLRRGSIINTHQVTFADLCFDTNKRLAIRYDSEVRLSRRESDFLRTFIRSLDGLVSKEELQRLYWKNGYEEITKSAIHVTIQRLRKKLQPLEVQIESVYGLGYRLTV